MSRESASQLDAGRIFKSSSTSTDDFKLTNSWVHNIDWDSSNDEEQSNPEEVSEVP